jgi:peptidoglycan hydrolase-like protein with peptidoglycan-binding domain
MKNLFLINEEEKNRILNLHETATKRHYLSEQQTMENVIRLTESDLKKTIKKVLLREDDEPLPEMKTVPLGKVEAVQQALVDAGYSVGPKGVDGVFGKNTRSAVLKYQKDNGIKQTGNVGPITAGRLGVQQLTSGKPSQSQTTTATTQKKDTIPQTRTSTTQKKDTIPQTSEKLKKKIGEFSKRTQEQLKSMQSKGQLKNDSFIIVNKSAAMASLFGPNYKFITNSAITSGKIKDTGVENKVDNSHKNWMKISLDYAKKNPTSKEGIEINNWLKKYKDKIGLINSDGSVNWLTYLAMYTAKTIDSFPVSYEARTKSGLDITPSGVFGLSSGSKTKGYAGENEGENSFPLIQPDSVGEIAPAIHGFASEKRGKLIDKATGQPFDVDKDYTRAGSGCINVTPNFLTKMRETKPSYVIILPDSGGIVDIKLTTFENFKIKLTQLGSKCINSLSSLFS